MKHPLLRDRLTAALILLFRIALLIWLVYSYKLLLDADYIWIYGTYRFSLRESLEYFTCQSNFLAILTAALSLPFSLLRVFGIKTPRVIEIIQAVNAVNMMILLIGYAVVYGPTADWVFLNVTQHALNPALVVLDFLLCVRPGAVKLWQLPLSFIPMGFYSLYTYFYLFPRHIILYPEILNEGVFQSSRFIGLYALGFLMITVFFLALYAVSRLKKRLFPRFQAPYHKKASEKE